MNRLPQYFMPVPDRYGDGSFDVMVRDAGSAVIFWDLPAARSTATHGAQLAIRAVALASDTCELLPLHDHSGHLLLPLSDPGRDYRIDLGWLSEAGGFAPLAGEDISLPSAPPRYQPRLNDATSTSLAAMRHARYSPLATPVERRGFRPGLAS